MNAQPWLPPASAVRLPGRGRTWVYDSGTPAQGSEPREPVLLLHGWTSTAALNWYRCMPALSRQYRTVAMDHRGHGRGIRSRLPFRLEDCADDAAALIHHLGIGPCTVVGYSMGGPVAQLLWKRHPEAVSSLVLCATAAHFRTRSQLGEAIGRIGFGASVGLSLVPPVVRRTGMNYATSRWTAANGSALWATEEWARHDPAALVQAGLALARFDSRPWLASIDVPTAVVVTEADVTVPPGRQRFLADSIPDALTFPVDADHRACVDSPRLFVPALLSSLEVVQHRVEAFSHPS